MIRDLYRAVVRGLTRNVAFTSPTAADPRLRGRTYAIPFEEVWQVALELLGGGFDRWEVLEADDQEGIMRGLAGSSMDRFTSAITIRITLDADAQTRVDALSASRTGRADFGMNARRLRRLFAALDDRLAERRGRIDALRLDTRRDAAPLAGRA